MARYMWSGKEPILVETDDFPIRSAGEQYTGETRTLYFLTEEDSARIIREQGFDVHPEAEIGVLITSDRLTAYDVQWHANGIKGVLGKGAALNALADHWFGKLCAGDGCLAPVRNHLLAAPHSNVRVVQAARMVPIEAIARSHLCGEMYDAYKEGQRTFEGIELPDGLTENHSLRRLVAQGDKYICTPEKKILRGADDLELHHDIPVTVAEAAETFKSLTFGSREGVAGMQVILECVFDVVVAKMRSLGYTVGGLKCEVGYVRDKSTGKYDNMILIDEVGTPDSMRMWSGHAMRTPRYECKQLFREYLIEQLSRNGDLRILSKDTPLSERQAYADQFVVGVSELLTLSGMYTRLAAEVTGKEVAISKDYHADICDALQPFGILK